MKFSLTERAAEAIKTALHEQAAEGLRVGVRGGGCSGLSYVLELGNAKELDNTIELSGAKVFIDPKSAVFLEDCQLDYIKSLLETGFKISNPKVTRTCGCGESFSL